MCDPPQIRRRTSRPTNSCHLWPAPLHDKGDQMKHSQAPATPGVPVYILFNRSIDPDEESVPSYNILIWLRSINEGEEFLAAAAQSLGHIEMGEDAESVEQVKLICYVHVFNEQSMRGME